MDIDDVRNLLCPYALGRKPIKRVAPAIEMASQRMEVIRICLNAIADECGPESDALTGAARMILDVQSELSEAQEVLEHELFGACNNDL